MSKLSNLLTEAFEKKLLNNPKEGNTYAVKGITTKGQEVYPKNARFVGKNKNTSGEWVYVFRAQDTGGTFSFSEGQFQLHPPQWK